MLVTCGGGFQGLAVLEGLRRVEGVRMIVADSSAENVGQHFASAFRLAPSLGEPDRYLAFLDELVERDALDLVIPATDLDLPLLAGVRDDFRSRHVAIAVCGPELLAKLLDKRATYGYCTEAGVAVLPELDLDPDAPVEAAVIAKPLRGFGGKSQYVLEPGQVPAIAAHGATRSSHLWQPYLAGATEISVDFAIDMRGRVSPLAPRQRIRSFSGFSILGRSAEDRADVLAIVGRLADRLARDGGRGGFNVQLIDADSGPVVIDVNARFGTSSALALEMGVNLQAWLLERPAGELTGGRSLVRYVGQRSRPTTPIDVAAIVLDLDDTLIDQKTWIADKLDLLHQARKTRLPPREQFLAAAFQVLEEGNRARLIDGIIAHLGLSPEMRDDLIETYRSLVPATIATYPDAGRVLAELRSRGYRIGLLSDNPVSSQRQKLARLAETACGSVPFDAVVLTGELAATKPEPAAFRAVADALGLPAARLAMVGDNLFRDALGALEAGFGASFHLDRRGSFFSFSRTLAAELAGHARVRWIEDLDQLLWHLPVSPRTGN